MIGLHVELKVGSYFFFLHLKIWKSSHTSLSYIYAKKIKMKTFFNAFLHHFLISPQFFTLEHYSCGLLDHASTHLNYEFNVISLKKIQFHKNYSKFNISPNLMSKNYKITSKKPLIMGFSTRYQIGLQFP
jgi:hypothetical protein